MLTTPPPPRLSDDAYTMPITATPTIGELGVHTFGRTITQHLTTVLKVPVAPPTYRENRQDQRKLPKAATYELTVAANTVLITSFDIDHPLSRSPQRVYTIEINGNRIPFELTNPRDVEWQIARTIWFALPADPPNQAPTNTATDSTTTATVTDPATLRARADNALRTGPARVDRILTSNHHEPGQVCIIADDGAILWFHYHPTTAHAYLAAIQEPDHQPDIPTGPGCNDHGFRLAGDHPHLLLELLALTHRDLTIVRGHPAAFVGIGMP